MIVTQTIMHDLANDVASRRFGALDIRSIALLLDVDGTLIDIGPSPFAVDVPDTLKQSLTKLYDLTGGAVALVSGRPIRDLDMLFAPLRLPLVGGHGAEMRPAPAADITRIADLPPAMRTFLTEAAVDGSGIEFEDKGYSVALHYRRAPQHEERLRAHVAASREAFPDEDTVVLLGKAMFEVKRRHINKGDGLRALMAYPPFAGRRPVFIGDDVTDEAAFAALLEWGGIGFSVGRDFGPVSGTMAGIFSSPEEVRRVLRRLADDE